MPGKASKPYIYLNYGAGGASIFAGAAGTDTKVAIDSSHVVNSSGMSVDDTNDRILTPQSGDWLIAFDLPMWSGSTGDAYNTVSVKSDGVVLVDKEQQMKGTSDITVSMVPMRITLTAGEYITLEHRSSDGTRAYDINDYSFSMSKV